jgi:asparagine synthase (glutamine-hydrolysing)
LIGLDELAGGTTIERVTGLCLRGYTNNQLLRDIDAVSMAHSLEVRVPYLDVDMVDMALSLPDETKLGKVEMFFGPEKKTYRETGAKRILIDIGRSLLPVDFDRQAKRGFGMPFEAWLKGPLRDVFLDTLSESNLTRRGLLDVQKAVDVRNRFLEGHLSWAQPWTLMMLELWCQEVLDSPYGRG